jgi:hypothetical protein
MPMPRSPIRKTRTAAAKFAAHAVVLWAMLAICAASVSTAPRPQAGNAMARISFGTDLSATPLDGRVFIVFSVNQNNPRMGVVEEEVESAQVFGADVDGLAPGQSATIPLDAIGYPARTLADIPPGDYWVQGVLNKYTTFRRSDGHTVKLPMDEGEGQHWNSKPGNFYSTPQKIHVDPHSFTAIDVKLDNVIPKIQPPPDTEWVKHVQIQSQVLTKFWGHPMYLGAIVVLPEGWATHPNARYPLLVNHGHFQADFNGFRTGGGRRGGGAANAGQPTQLFQDWSTGKLPRMILLIIQHANPYYDDSYAVDSANVGPYGEAINKELIPYIEKQFHAIGQGWARAIFGGSTGGWETLATQIFYPDDYNGAWGACPDPVDFHAYQLVNIYDDANAYWTIGPFGRIAQGEMRFPNGIVQATTEGSNRWEYVLGTKGRSGEQWGIWQAVFSPVGDDGYPKPIWDPVTGVINKDVAEYWRQHYDLTAIMMRDWKTLGPKLVGKLHVPVGTGDTYYLNNAVRLMQAAMEKTADPHYVADFDFGIDQPHCYTGPPGDTTRHGGATFTQRVLAAAEKQMLATAPAGADTTSWRY